CLVTSRPTLLDVSVQMHGVGIPASDSQSHLHSYHGLDSIAENVGDGCQCDSVERRLDDWHKRPAWAFKLQQ
ncbi:hypothetical protein BGY98DRAFT_1040772, partial [Russula aff. rugulosa BPL654]